MPHCKCGTSVEWEWRHLVLVLWKVLIEKYFRTCYYETQSPGTLYCQSWGRGLHSIFYYTEYLLEFSSFVKYFVFCYLALLENYTEKLKFSM